jgi:hypothetical protein
MTPTWLNNIIAISGTPTGTPTSFNYTIPLTGGCGSVNATGTIVVNPCTINTVEVFGTKNGVVGVSLNIPIVTTGATGKGIETGLPPGLVADWQSGVGLVLYGAPTASGTYNFEIPLTGGCGNVKATGTIVVEAPQCRVDITGNTVFNSGYQIVGSITLFTTSGVTGIGTPTGILEGMNVEWNSGSKEIMIKGNVPGVLSTQGFPFSIPLNVVPGCTLSSAQGTITINP